MNKINEGSIKVFKFLKLLHENEATYANVLELFKDDIKEKPSRSYLHVIINKYLNTLKVFGIKVIKEGNNYRLNNNLYSMSFNAYDLRSISILMKAIEKFPDDKIKRHVEKFIFSLRLRMNKWSKLSLDKYFGDYDFSFYYSPLREQIKHCQKVCLDEFIFEIIFLENNEKRSLKKCKPIELIYNSQNVYFKLYSPQINSYIDIPLPNILTIKSMPQKIPYRDISTTVVYILKGRLAETYKLKENEVSPGYNDKGELVVINKDESINVLLNRLMRYMDLCEIKTPIYVREQMLKLLNSTLAKYQ